MLSLEQIMSPLRDFVKKQFNVSDGDKDFNDDVHLFDYGYVDSFGAVHLINFVKERFGVTVSDQDLIVHPLNTVREIAALVQTRLPVK